MTLTVPYPPELLRIAEKVVWYDRPEETLANLATFLANLMAYGSPGDLAVTRRYVPTEEFRKVFENAPAGPFIKEVWQSRHEQLGMPLQPLPRRRFPDGSLGPEPGRFFGR